MTFQEGLLSKRLLVFTEHQMSFYCSISSWMEGLGNPDPNADHQANERGHPANLFGRLMVLTSPTWNWSHYVKLLEMYSRRQITKEVDTLDAFLGVTNHIRRSRPDVQLLRGLPFFKISGETSRVTLIDTIEKLVTAALSWHSCEDESNAPQRQSTIPSWTWAGWSGRATFWICDTIGGKHQSFVRYPRLESSSGQIVVSYARDKDNTQHELDNVTVVQFEAPITSASSFSVTEEHQTEGNNSDDSSSTGGPKFKLAGRPLLRNTVGRYRGIYTYHQLVENVRNGTWSCFMLSAGGYSEGYSVFVLVVRWEADQVTAERIGSFCTLSDLNDSARLGPFEAESWTRRRVRLI
jgi:hypothetical protein